MRIRKIIGMLAVGMLSLSLLAGCGSTKEENPKEQKPQTKKQETADTGTKEKIMAEIKVKDYGTITVAPGSGACADYRRKLCKTGKRRFL